MKKWHLTAYVLILALLLLITVVGGVLLQWYKTNFGVSIVEIMYTIESPLAGADYSFLKSGIKTGGAALVTALLLIFLVHDMVKNGAADPFESGEDLFTKGLTISLAFILMIVGAGTYGVIKDANDVFKITDFIKARNDTTLIYDDYYAEPEIEGITADNPRNLVYIFLESMETSYASEDEGGLQKDNNYIPNLTIMADENISFSDKERLGGFHCCNGAGWTMGALFTSHSGIPFSFPVEDGNSMNSREAFAKGTITLGDILQKKGYYQEFLCGSDGNFGGRKQFFEQHGQYRVYDLKTATDDGYISEEEYVFWGMEDKDLYKVARDELTKISQSNTPFNFTMLTVDTHHEGGWVCDLCDDKYTEPLANVIECADRQIADFIEWCKEQPWYDNTTIVIQGDHPRMDGVLVNEFDYYDRTVYNCFINAPFEKEHVRYRNREFSGFDMLPTVIASIGFEIPDDRLGLGTNLFSYKKTLCEQLGFDYVNNELSKYSDYYKKFY